MKEIIFEDFAFQIFRSYTGRKTYIVGGTGFLQSQTYARKFFKATKEHIKTVIGYLYGGELYLEDPEKKGTRAVWVSYWVK